MKYSLRRQCLIVLAGFLAVAIGWVGYTAALWNGPVSGFHATVIFGLGNVVGYVVLAAAAWSWLAWIESSGFPLPGMSRALRLFAVGNLCPAAGLAAVGYYWSRQAIAHPYDRHLVIVIASAYGFEFFGFLLVSAALWSAASEIHPDRVGASSPEDELVPA